MNQRQIFRSVSPIPAQIQVICRYGITGKPPPVRKLGRIETVVTNIKKVVLMLLCRKIKLEVSQQNAQTLEFMQDKCRGLYNWWIMRLRNGEKWPGWKEAKASLQESKEYDPELKDVYGKLLHEVYFRADKAIQAFFRRNKNGEKPGFPRFKQRHAFFTLCKKSQRYIYLSKVYRRISERKRKKQRDSLHKASHLISYKLVESTIVVGDLSQRQMVMKCHQEHNTYLNRAVYNDWGLYTFLKMLHYKCQLHGKELIFLDERNTSKMCNKCGHLQNMPLWKRIYRCTSCGLVMDRDENAAVNILKRYVARLGPHTGDPVRCADVFTAINTFQHV
jgi:IS605 OrfB family transposase